MKTIEEVEEIKELVSATGLSHVAIIMDGNRRWAKEKFLPSAMGHKRGVETLKETIKSCHEFGIKYLTVYAFSTENWNRSHEEVDFLMKLLAQTIVHELSELHENGVRIRFIGDLSRLNKTLVDILENAQDVTKDNVGVNLQIAFNYGSRDELINAVQKIAQKVRLGELEPDAITEKSIDENLYTSGIPDPDLLIRTGGEMRISNYLLWQLAYSEIYVTPKYWPEFDRNAFEEAIFEFEQRNRRFGK